MLQHASIERKRSSCLYAASACALRLLSACVDPDWPRSFAVRTIRMHRTICAHRIDTREREPRCMLTLLRRDSPRAILSASLTECASLCASHSWAHARLARRDHACVCRRCGAHGRAAGSGCVSAAEKGERRREERLGSLSARRAESACEASRRESGGGACGWRHSRARGDSSGGSGPKSELRRRRSGRVPSPPEGAY